VTKAVALSASGRRLFLPSGSEDEDDEDDEKEGWYCVARVTIVQCTCPSQALSRRRRRRALSRRRSVSPRAQATTDAESVEIDRTARGQHVSQGDAIPSSFSSSSSSSSSLPLGKNSLRPEAESATAFVTTLYGDLRTWRGGELLFNLR